MMPAAKSLITDSSAAAQYRIIAIDGGMTTAMAPDEAIKPTEKRSL